jgi:hypothetical protein
MIDIAFSFDSRGIAALYHEDRKARLACWRTDNGQIIVHHQAEKWWNDIIPGLGSEGNEIQWLADKRGWLLGGYAMVDRDRCEVQWRLSRNISPTYLIDGKNLLWSISAGFDDYLVCNPIMLEQAFDPEQRERQEGPKNPFGSDLHLVAIVRLEIKSYPAGGDAATIARGVLAPIGWADSRAIAIDRERNEVVIGVRIMMVNTGPAKQALERAGFIIGGSMISPLQN